MAALVKLLYSNKGLAATWSATSAVATLPASHLGDTNRQRVWRSTGLAAPERVVADLGSALAIDAVALVSHNLRTSATVTIKANTADAWGSPAFSVAFTIYDDKDANTVVKFLASTQTYRYWAIELTDAGAPDGYFQIGVAVLSPVFSFGDAPNELHFTVVDPSVVAYAPSGTPQTEERTPYAAVDLEWTALTEAMVFGDLQTVLRTIGRKKDGVLVIFASDPSADDISKSLTLYGRLVDLQPFEAFGAQGGPRWRWPMAFRESL